jgi:Uma2 family endonuclease
MDVKLDDLNVVQPDVFITCKPENLTERYLNGAPDFVCEIVSSSRSDDDIRKLYLYQSSSVREYWIIDPGTERVFVYFFENGNSPEIYDFHTPIPVQIWEGRLCVTVSDLKLV